MENQYCRVGSVTPISNEPQAVILLEYHYQSFLEKASDMQYAGTSLGEFFENKAKQLKKILEKLV